MEERVEIAGLAVSKPLYELIRDEAAPGTGVDPEHFWSSLAAIVSDLEPGNRALLERRDALQADIDDWHRRHRGCDPSPPEMREFLSRIGYLVPEGPDFEIATENVDSGDRERRRPATGGSAELGPLRAERRQRTLGKSLRRALRQRRGAGRGRSGARTPIQPHAGPAGHGKGCRVSGRGGGSGEGLPPGRRRVSPAARPERTARSGARGRDPHRTRGPGVFRGLPPGRGSACLRAAAPSRPAHRDPHRSRRRRRAPASRGA